MCVVGLSSNAMMGYCRSDATAGEFESHQLRLSMSSPALQQKQSLERALRHRTRGDPLLTGATILMNATHAVRHPSHSVRMR
jgi:hypothetical protein